MFYIFNIFLFIYTLTHSYQENRNDPPISRCAPPVSGRIQWVRFLFRNIDEPMKFLSSKKSIIENPKCQLCIKYYNIVSELLTHYEVTHHKAWYDYTTDILKKLSYPLIVTNKKTQRYEVNMDESVFRMIREAEAMMKLDLAVPNILKVLVFCKEKLTNPHNQLTSLIRRNDRLRFSIADSVLVKFMRPLLQRLTDAFRPGLTIITWKSKTIDDYFSHVEKCLDDSEFFFKGATDIVKHQIESGLDKISNYELIELPEGPVSPEIFIEMNNACRRAVERKISIVSQTVEEATVNLINKFIGAIEVKDYDENGTYIYQADVITESNFRVEETKPIDKWDWIKFDKIGQAGFTASQKQREKMVFKDEGDNFHYEQMQLHADAMELYNFFYGGLITSLTKCTAQSLNALKVRSNLTKYVIN